MKRFTLLLASSVWFLTISAPALIDTNNNGLSDLWEKANNNGQLFPTTYDPQADPDHDGWTNSQEAAAGTDPTNSNPPTGILRPDVAQIPAVMGTDANGQPVVITPDSIVISWATLPGKQYTLLHSFDLAGGSWLPFDAPFIGNGNIVEYGYPAADADKLFWRVAVTDADSDEDGLNDAEESALGTNPDDGDTDRDGLADAEEVKIGSNPNNIHSDNDSLVDGVDADPNESLVDWRRVSEGQFAMLDIDVPEGQSPRDLNDNGDILFFDGFWADGEWHELNAPPMSGGFPREAGDEGVSTYESQANIWTHFNNNRRLLGGTECWVTFTPDPGSDAGGGEAFFYGVASWPESQQPQYCEEMASRLPASIRNTLGSFAPLGIAADGRQAAIASYVEDVDPDPDVSELEERTRLAVFPVNGDDPAILTPPDDYLIDLSYSTDARVTPSGWIVCQSRKTTRPDPNASPLTSFRTDLWMPDNTRLQLEEVNEFLSHYSLSTLPNSRLGVTCVNQWNGSSLILRDTTGQFVKSEQLSNQSIKYFAGDGTAMTTDHKLWRNGKLVPLRDLCPRYEELQDDGLNLIPLKGNGHGDHLLLIAENESENQTKLMIPARVVSRDKFMTGYVEIPPGLGSMELEFLGPNNENLGRYGDLGGGGDTKVYDSREDMFKSPVSEDPETQKVWFVRDPGAPRRLYFYTCFNAVGSASVKIYLGGKSASCGELRHDLLPAPDFAAIIAYVDRWVKGSSFTGEWAGQSWLTMSVGSQAGEIAGEIANQTRVCLAPFIDVIDQVSGLTPTVMGLCDGIRCGYRDDKEFLTFLGNAGLTSLNWAYQSALTEVDAWAADPAKRAEQLKEILYDLCNESILPRLQELGERFTSWESFRDMAWDAWEKFRGLDLKYRVVKWQVGIVVVQALFEWGDDFCNRMMEGAEKAEWNNVAWESVPFLVDVELYRNRAYYTMGYCYGYLGEQVVVGALGEGAVTVAKVLVKNGISLAARLAPRTMAALAVRFHLLKEALRSFDLFDDGMRLAYEGALSGPGKEPISPTIREVPLSKMEGRMSTQPFNRTTFNFKKLVDAAAADGNIRKLILRHPDKTILSRRTGQLMHLLGDDCDELTMKYFLKAAEERVVIPHADGTLDEWFEGFFRAFEGNPTLANNLDDPMHSIAAWSNGAKERFKLFISENSMWKLDDPVFVDGVPQIPQNYFTRGVVGELDLYYRVYKKKGYIHHPSAVGYDYYGARIVQVKTCKNPSSSGNIDAMKRAIDALVEAAGSDPRQLILHILKKPGTDSKPLRDALEGYIESLDLGERVLLEIDPYDIGPL